MPRQKSSNKEQNDQQTIEMWKSLKESVDTARRELDKLSGRLESATEELEKFGCSDLQEAAEFVEEKKKIIEDMGQEFSEKVTESYRELEKIWKEENE